MRYVIQQGEDRTDGFNSVSFGIAEFFVEEGIFGVENLVEPDDPPANAGASQPTDEVEPGETETVAVETASESTDSEFEDSEQTVPVEVDDVVVRIYYAEDVTHCVRPADYRDIPAAFDDTVRPGHCVTYGLPPGWFEVRIHELRYVRQEVEDAEDLDDETKGYLLSIIHPYESVLVCVTAFMLEVIEDEAGSEEIVTSLDDEVPPDTASATNAA